MRRGTTPTIKFIIPFDGDDITELSIAFAQKLHGREPSIIFTKDLDDADIDEYEISVTLTEDETLRLRTDVPLEMQIRCAVGAGKLASNIMKTEVNKILQDGKL